jgi:hypothetical protein
MIQDNFGDGFGFGYWSGYGDGYGYGYGDGSGFGFGYGFGFGFGDGSGHGSGSGYGDGSGSGYGEGIEIGMIDDRPILWLHPWPYISVGCEVYHIDLWRDHWRDIATTHDVTIDEDVVDEILRRVIDYDLTFENCGH